MSDTNEQDGGNGYPPFLIPRPVNTIGHIGAMGHMGAMSPINVMGPPAPTRVNFYNPINGNVGPSFTNFQEVPMDKYVTEDYNKAGCQVTLSGKQETVEFVKKLLNTYLAIKHKENPYKLIGEETVELDSEMGTVMKKVADAFGSSASISATEVKGTSTSVGTSMTGGGLIRRK